MINQTRGFNYLASFVATNVDVTCTRAPVSSLHEGKKGACLWMTLLRLSLDQLPQTPGELLQTLDVTQPEKSLFFILTKVRIKI